MLDDLIGKDDYEAIEKARIIYDALYINCKLKIIRSLHQSEIEKLDKRERRVFLKKKLME